MRNYYEQEVAEKDMAKLVDVYYRRGFLDVKTTLVRKFNEKKNKVALTFAIEEGPAYKVGQVTVVGNTHFDQAELMSGLKMQQGQTYDQRKADADLKGLAKDAGCTTVESALFSESNSRYIIEVAPENYDEFAKAMLDVPFGQVGKVVDGKTLKIVAEDSTSVIDIDIDTLKNAWQKPLNLG